MADERDYYEVLGVARDASAREIKSAYRKLAVRHHPDRNPGDREAEAAFKAAAEAYSVLSDPDKRARYDRFGRQGVGGGFGGFDPETFGDFSDILGDFFGFGDIFGRSARRPGGGRPGADLRYRLELSLEEAAFGVEKTLEVPRLETRRSTFQPIQGEIPSPLNPPGGCHFHPRCPHAMARCRDQVPALREIAPGRLSACHLNDGG